MTTPAMGAVREAFPRAEVVVAANPVVAELFSHHPYCDRVLVFDKKKTHGGAGGLLRFCAKLREERFDLAVFFQNAIEAALMGFIARIPNRAGYRTDGRGMLLTHSVPVSGAERRMHHTNYYLHMLESLGIRGGDGQLCLKSTAEEEARAQEMIGYDAPGRLAALNPGAAYGSAKRWLPERFAAVADRLSAEFGLKIILTGGAAEIELGRDIESAMSVRPLNLIGKTSVRELMAVISLCSLMVTNDSGPMHIGAAMGVPLVALFGSTDHTTTSPLSSSCRIVRKPVPCAPCLKRRCPTDHKCMDAITVQDVLDAVTLVHP